MNSNGKYSLCNEARMNSINLDCKSVEMKQPGSLFVYFLVYIIHSEHSLLVGKLYVFLLGQFSF